MSSFFIICALISIVAVVIVLLIGLFALAKGGDFNKKYGNKLMMARVVLQGLALLFLLLAYSG